MFTRAQQADDAYEQADWHAERAKALMKTAEEAHFGPYGRSERQRDRDVQRALTHATLARMYQDRAAMHLKEAR